MDTYVFLSASESRLDLILREKIPVLTGVSVSNSKIRRLIFAGKVFVRGKVVRQPYFEVPPKAEITVEIEKEKLLLEKKASDIDFAMTDKNLLYEDENIIAVNKPARFPCEQTFVEERNNLTKAVKEYLFQKLKEKSPNIVNLPYLGIMHRLDKDTSGVIMFTKKREANGFYHNAFENHLIKKEYFAIVSPKNKSAEKWLLKKDFSVSFYMGRISAKSHSAKWGRVEQEKGGVYSKTNFHVEKQLSPDLYLIKCMLETGRTHQIRVHLSSLSLPILGDVLYGGKNAGRVMLHSSKLTLPQIQEKSPLEIFAPFPDDFQTYIK